MKKLTTTLGVFGLAAAALATPPVAEARTVLALAGAPAVNSESSCYGGGSWGSVLRNASSGCPAITTYWWSLPIDNAGSKLVTITGLGPASCQAVSQNGTHTAASIGALSSFSSASSYVDITSTATVVGGGFLYAQCNVQATAEITRVNWPQ